MLHRLFQASLNCEIPLTAKIGAGFYLNHGYTTVISKKAKIGTNFTCFHLVTLGEKRGEGAPVLGDNVSVTAGAMIIGSVEVSDGVTVGAGSLILKDVPKNSIVAGNPQQIIRESDEIRTTNPAPSTLIH